MAGFWKKMMGDRWVGAFAASSHFVTRRVLREVRSEYRNFLEYGPGDGVLTRELVGKLPQDASFFAIERNPEFVTELNREISDPRVTIERGDAVMYARNQAENFPQSVDAAFSSIPFSFLSLDDRDALIKATSKLVKSDGVFVIFHQYSLLALPFLKKYFADVSWRFEPRNVFPCFVMVARAPRDRMSE